MSNDILKRIQQVIGNLVQACNVTQNYVDKYDPWLGILAAAEFSICSTTNNMKVYSPGQLVFGCDMIKNRNRVDHDYKVGDKGMLDNYDV